ncbi:microcephalin isoform X2 [Pseudophryne corroboree]|uniref:microcephalin isoform X2 n=1 Tax=Pseudophryne corroboree TaxID=495146 RepID=UPI003081B9FF
MELADTLSPGCGASGILSGVMAYVDVWSSNRTENYSKTFTQQLLNLGAKVSKTFNKTVTHVVFKDGSQGIWDKAVKGGVKLVSVLWVEKCREAAAYVDESVFPAINTNDGVHQLLKKKRKCMQPKDFVEKTPENDKRLARRFNKMFKELDVQKSSVDIPVLSFEDDGTLLYSPKAVVADRCNAMERRIKEMKNKRENLSPTASQVSQTVFEFSVLKPSIGSSPSVMTDSPRGQCPNDLNTSYDDIFGIMEKEVQVPSTSSNIHVMEGDAKDAFTLKYISLTPQKIKGLPSLEAVKKRRSSSCIQNKGRKSLKKLKTTDCTNDSLSDGSCNTPSEKNSYLGHTSVTNTVIGKHNLDTIDVYHTHSCFQNNGQMALNRMKTIETTTDNAIGGDALREPVPTKCGTSVLDYTSMANRLIAKCKEKGQLKLKSSHNLKPDLSVKVLKEPSKSHLSSCKTNSEDFSNFEDFFASTDVKSHKSKLKRFSLTLPPRSPSPPPLTLNKADDCRRRRSGVAFQQDLPRTKKRKTIHAVTHSTSRPRESSASLQETPLFLTAPAENDSGSKSCVMTYKTESPVRRRSRTSSKTNLQGSEAHLSGKDQLQRTSETANVFEPSFGLVIGLKKAVSSTTSRKTKDESGDEESLGLKNGTVLDCEKPMDRYQPNADNKTSVSDASDGLSEMFNGERTKCTVESKKIEKNRKVTRSLVMTSMSTEAQNAVIQVVKKFGGFVFSDCVCESTTHVIAGSPRRTLNIILGIARGCWIISYDWVLWSLECGHWIPEEPYELSDHFPGAPSGCEDPKNRVALLTTQKSGQISHFQQQNVCAMANSPSSVHFWCSMPPAVTSWLPKDLQIATPSISRRISARFTLHHPCLVHIPKQPASLSQSL